MPIDSPWLSNAREEPHRITRPEDVHSNSNTTTSTHPVTVRQRKVMVKPGVWSDGALSPHLPTVQACLKQARLQRRIPPTPCIIFALAALDVYSAYTDIAHWLFWGPRVKNETARTVDYVLNHRGVSIKSPVSWLGINENLYIIGSQQIAWRSQLSEMSWYHSLVVQTSERRILRKRKAAPVSFDFEGTTAATEIELPVRKRRRVTKPKPVVPVVVPEPHASTNKAVDHYGDERPVNRAREASVLSSLSSLSTVPTRASSEVSEDTAVSSSSRRRRSCSGSSAETAVGAGEPGKDDVIQSERQTRGAKRAKKHL